MIRLFFLLFLLSAPSLLATASSAESLESAKQDMASGRYVAAIESLRTLVAKEQTNYEAWFLFGVSHVHEQQYHQAIEAFRQVIALRPKLAEPHNNLAAVYNNLGDTKAAVRELEIALKKRPNYTVAEENLADLYIKLALHHYRNSLDHASTPAMEQRYARLLQVRNPINKNDVPSVPKEVAIEQPVPTKAVVVITPKPATMATEAPPSIAEDKSITGVLDALEAWRSAWSGKNLELYFAAYADDFNPGARFDSKDAWQTYKKQVIQNKDFIKVRFEKVEVDIPASRELAHISVLQHFTSNNYNSDDNKKITMKYTANSWKIISEVAAP